MKFLYSDEPIIACSTCNHANAALAVLRISGFKDLAAFSPFFTHSGPIEPRRVYYTKLRSGDEILDDICLTYFEGPKSYNGENILELSIHGNTLNTERILKFFISKTNCRLAAPGEFTYRALKNKKLTLSQVEGLDLFLNANSGYALDQGLSLLSGNLQETYTELYDLFLKHKSALELSIDFIDDVGEETAKGYFDASLADFKKKFESLHRRVIPMEHNLIQPEIVLAGLPNSGKSSLFNHLLQEERAIVSAVAGTTRDYLSESVVIDEVKYKLIDTAGIREATDLIEAEGIKRTKKKMQHSFFSVLLINPLQMREEFSALAKLHFDAVYFTHKDMPGFAAAQQKVIADFPQFGPMGAVNLLAEISSLEKELFQCVNKKYLQATQNKPILLDRHKLLISQVSVQLESYIKLSTYESDVAILSHELNILATCLSELLGIVSPDQILNSIFSNFCIGK
ncbi:MAG: 50S ribosome-binding GTPase [Bdellovibrionales bacterium]|nr:50S ribosome-binding GTPase [Bdellovibrionales bacterium]